MKETVIAFIGSSIGQSILGFVVLAVAYLGKIYFAKLSAKLAAELESAEAKTSHYWEMYLKEFIGSKALELFGTTLKDLKQAYADGKITKEEYLETALDCKAVIVSAVYQLIQKAPDIIKAKYGNEGVIGGVVEGVVSALQGAGIMTVSKTAQDLVALPPKADSEMASGSESPQIN